MDDQPKETQQSTTSCSGRNIGGSGNVDSNGNGNGGGGGGGDDNNNSGGRRVMGRQVWGRCQAAKGSRNGDKAEMGNKVGMIIDETFY
jgi:hypothetical protein